MLTASKLEGIQSQAQEEGYAAGHAQGLKAGEAQAKANIESLAKLFKSLARPLEQIDDQVQQELVALAIAIARQIIRRELKLDPGHMVGIVRDALNHLPLANRTIQIRLHPDDATVVKELLSVDEKSENWKIIDDAALSRGDCRVVSETSQIDASLDKRLAAIAASLLGGERDGESETP